MANLLKSLNELTAGQAGTVGQSLYLNATIGETGDAPAGRSGNPVISVGDRFEGSIGTVGDRDTIAITLEAGESYVFTVFGTNGVGSGLTDPTVTILDSSGATVAFNDDIGSGSTFSALNFTATQTGTYFIRVAAFAGTSPYVGETGTYALTTSTSVYDVEHVASFITEMAWGIPTPIHFDESPGGIITYNLSNLTAAGQQLAEWAFEAWSAVSGLVFQSDSANTADIVFFDGASDTIPARYSGVFPVNTGGAYAGPSSYDPSTGIVNFAGVNVGTQWINFYGTTIDSYSFQTYIHEIGHALGLGHAGPYDGTATYGSDNLFLNDSVNMSIMSYFSLTDNTFVDGDGGIVITPMIADIYAIQQLYGATAVNAGNTIWGAGSNISGYLGDIFRIMFDGEPDLSGMLAGNQNLILTIADTDGIDTLDFSTNNNASRIDLREGAVSDLFGFVGNMVIALGTIIENINLGAGNDTVVGNAADNRISGGLGNDSIDGGDGSDTAIINATFASVTSITINGDVVRIVSSQGTDDFTNVELFEFSDQTVTLATLSGNGSITGTENADTLSGTTGDDTIFGLGGNDRLIGDQGNDSLFGGAQNDRLDGGIGNDTMVGGSGNDLYIVGSVGDLVFETTDTNTTTDAGGVDTVQSAVSFDLDAYAGVQFVENLVLTGAGNIDGFGNSLANEVTGNSGNNLLRGGAGNDTLDGGTGNDTMFGGEGDDVYVVNSAADLVFETTTDSSTTDSGGVDTVRSSVSFSLGLYSGVRFVERLILTGSANINATGNAQHNVITGNSGNNLINGGLGNDTMAGGAGNDTYIVNAIFDFVDETTNGSTDAGGFDTVVSTVTYNLDAYSEVRFVERLLLSGSANVNAFGNALNNLIAGNSGNNILNGGVGDDTMIGGAGNDTYFVNSSGDLVFEFATGLVDAGGVDTIVSDVTFSLDAYLGVRFVEQLILTGSANINAIGNALDNVLIGNDGNNFISGGQGDDTMTGGAGNDTYVVDSAGDLVFETTSAASDAGGFDTVLSSVSFNLGAYAGVSFVEQLNLTGSANINAFGNALNNVLIGNSGNNFLNGGLGNDTMFGGAGNDTYVVDSADDRIFETTNTAADAGGFDIVLSSVSLNLDAYGGIRFVEQLNLTGSANIEATGNDLGNVLIGNSGNNRMNGGLGADTMVGGAGNDTFIFNTALGAGNVDRISDFNVIDDTINLDDAIFAGLATGTLAGSAFVSNASGVATDSLDRIIYETSSGNLYFDADGSGSGNRVHFATITPNLALTSADFFVF